ncbi:hypothetical protein Pelo_5293 [Pelomyxa schiedti]|nr:hypothetical protein Pelo_5293 [Pelomyxa schiedti]
MSDERSGEGEELEVSDGDEEGGSDEGAGSRGVDEELLAASRKCDVGKMKSLLNDMGANAAFESFKEGTWGARTRVSPIHLAIKAWNSPSRVEAITLLLEHGAKVNAKYEDYDWRGCGVEETAFQMIQGTDNADLQILFLKHGADPNIPHLRDAHTMRYDGQRMEYPIHEAVISGNVAFLNALLDAGAKVDSLFVDSGQSEYGPRTNTMQTALFLACANNNLPMAQTLLERGANANLVTNHVKHENIPDTESGTDDPRDPNYVSKIRNVPVSEVALHRAIIDNRPDLVSLLILHGADTSPQYHEGPKILTTKQLCDQSPSPAGSIVLIPEDFQVDSETIISHWNSGALFLYQDTVSHIPRTITQRDIYKVKKALTKLKEGGVVAITGTKEDRVGKECTLDEPQWEVFKEFVSDFWIRSYEMDGDDIPSRVMGIPQRSLSQGMAKPEHHNLQGELVHQMKPLTGRAAQNACTATSSPYVGPNTPIDHT